MGEYLLFCRTNARQDQITNGTDRNDNISLCEPYGKGGVGRWDGEATK